MANEAMHKMIGRALTDRQFRDDLLRSPLEATRDMSLTTQERELIASVHASSLEELSCMLNDRLPESRESRRYWEPETGAVA
jgi:hypothetical protein